MENYIKVGKIGDFSKKNYKCIRYLTKHIGVFKNEDESFYSPNSNWEYLEQLGEIGIKPIFFEEIGYSPISEEFAEVNNCKEIIKISSNEVREAFKDGKKLPNWFMRSPIQDLLLDAIKKGVEVFQL